MTGLPRRLRLRAVAIEKCALVQLFYFYLDSIPSGAVLVEWLYFMFLFQFRDQIGSSANRRTLRRKTPCHL